MVKITVLDNQTKIETEEIEIYISGDFEIKRKSEIKETPVAGTTDAKIKLDSKKIANNLISSWEKCHNY